MKTNILYPIFLKLDQIEVLIIGAGTVGLEKLTYILKNTPNAKITVIAKEIDYSVEALSNFYSNIVLVKKNYHKTDLEGIDLLIVATENRILNLQIKKDAQQMNLLTNVADQPDLCDFYLGSIVTKGTLKLGISTNGKSPTLAKRLREFFEDVIPENIDFTARSLYEIREKLKGDLHHKINSLNNVTMVFKKNTVQTISHQNKQNKQIDFKLYLN